MSRFVEILNRHEYEITVESFRTMLTEMAHALDAQSGYVEMRFPTSSTNARRSPEWRAWMDYQVTLTGEFVEGPP